jgi:hypothetical protein
MDALSVAPWIERSEPDNAIFIRDSMSSRADFELDLIDYSQ